MKKIFVLSLMFFGIFSKTTFASEISKNEETDLYSLDNQIYESILFEEDILKNAEKVYFMFTDENSEFFLEVKSRNIPYEILGPQISFFSTNNFTHFKSISWISRSDGVSLSLEPKNPWGIDKSSSWQEAVRFFQYHPFYRNEANSTKYSSMQNQYFCHVDFAKGIKTPWNIEPWRNDKGYNGFVRSGCN